MKSVDRTLCEAVRRPTARERTDPVAAYKYARDVVAGPFPSGEAVIAKNACHSYLYALNVLEGPFPKGEAAIITDPLWASDYARLVLGRPWPEAEATIAQSAWPALEYAKDCLKGPFPAAEKCILQDTVAIPANRLTVAIYTNILKDAGYNPDEYWLERIASGAVTAEDVYGQ